MANYKLGDRQYDIVSAQARFLCDRRINTARQDFPLTIDQVQDAMVPAELLHLFRELTRLGADTVRKVNDIHPCTPDGLEGVQRRAMLNITLPQHIHITHTRHGFRHIGKLNDADRLQLNLSELPQETLSAFASWVNGVVREHRLKELVMKTIYGFFTLDLAASTYSIHARWPLLNTLLVEADRDTWQPRVNDLPKPTAMGRWKFNSERSSTRDNAWYADNKKLMEAVDVVLTGAMMMPLPSFPPGAIQVSVTEWEKLPGDNF